MKKYHGNYIYYGEFMFGINHNRSCFILVLLILVLIHFLEATQERVENSNHTAIEIIKKTFNTQSPEKTVKKTEG